MKKNKETRMNEQTLLEIEDARQEVKAGKVYSTSQTMLCLGIKE